MIFYIIKYHLYRTHSSWSSSSWWFINSQSTCFFSSLMNRYTPFTQNTFLSSSLRTQFVDYLSSSHQNTHPSIILSNSDVSPIYEQLTMFTKATPPVSSASTLPNKDEIKNYYHDSFYNYLYLLSQYQSNDPSMFLLLLLILIDYKNVQKEIHEIQTQLNKMKK